MFVLFDGRIMGAAPLGDHKPMPGRLPRHLSACGAAVIVAVVPLGCSDEAPTPQSGVVPLEGASGEIDPDGPRIEVDKSYLDFGVVLIGKELQHDFIIRNPGEKTLRLTHEKTSCGCTAAVVTDRDIPPGGSGTVQVRYTPKDSRVFGHHVNVFHNVESLKPVRFDIRGQGRPALVGPRLISMGRLHSGERTERVVPLDMAEGTDLRVEAFGASHSFLEAKVMRDGGRVMLAVAFDGQPAPEPFRGWVWFETDRKQNRRVVIPVTGVVTADLEAEPPRLYLGRVKAGTERSKSVRLSARWGAVGDVDVQVAGPRWVTARVTPAGDEAELTVSLGPEAKAGHSTARVRVSRAGNQWIEIPVHGYVVSGT